MKKERKSISPKKYDSHFFSAYCWMSLFFSISLALCSINQTKYTGILFWIMSVVMTLCYFSLSMLFGIDAYKNDIEEQLDAETKRKHSLEKKKTA